MAEKSHLHAGHRERLREQFLSVGTDAFRAHQILEFLLFYSVPRRDTNNLAHALIEHFGSASRALLADERDLTEVDGIGAHTAHFFSDYVKFVTGALDAPYEQTTRTKRECDAMIQKILLTHYQEQPHEHAVILLINNHFEVFDVRTVAEGSIHSARFHPKEAVRIALDRHASLAVIAHNHPLGLAVPSNEDRVITEELVRYFNLVGIKLHNHLIVANGRTASLVHEDKKQAENESPFRHSTKLSADAFAEEEEFSAHAAIGFSRTQENLSLDRQKELLAAFLSYAMPEEKAREWSDHALCIHPHLQAICSQPLEWLEALGLPRSAAALLKLALPSYAACLLKSHRVAPLINASSIGSAVTLRCMTLTGESIFLLLFDNKMRQLSFSRVSDGVVNGSEVSTRRIVELAHFSRASYAILVHNHPFGTTIASQNDIIATHSFVEALSVAHCTLIEHFIVSGNRFSPLLLLLKNKAAPGFALKNFYTADFLKSFPTIKIEER